MESMSNIWDMWLTRLWRRWRLLVIWVSFRVPARLEKRLVDYLYPDDLYVEILQE